jgi:hypothetical protein
MTKPYAPWKGLRDDIQQGLTVVFCESETDETITYRMRDTNGLIVLRTYNKDET